MEKEKTDDLTPVDFFAGCALIGLLASGENHNDGSTDDVMYAERAYKYAKAMIVGRLAKNYSNYMTFIEEKLQNEIKKHIFLHDKNCCLDEDNIEGLHCCDNMEKIKNIVEQALEQQKLAIVEKISSMNKEQLDKNDPDNYGACYAIGGFNDALNKSKEIIKNL